MLTIHCSIKKGGLWDVYWRNFTYFPQWSGVKIEVEPERQECRNEIKEVIDTRRLDTGTCYWQFDDLDKLPETSCPLIKVNVTSCQTIPAVTKTLSGWAVSENDLATEFCKAKTYELNSKKRQCYNQTHIKVTQFLPPEQCNLEIKSMAACVKIENVTEVICYRNDVTETKFFTSGEVVEVDKWKKIFPNGVFEYNQKQKLVRCSDGSVTKDYDIFGGK